MPRVVALSVFEVVRDPVGASGDRALMLSLGLIVTQQGGDVLAKRRDVRELLVRGGAAERDEVLDNLVDLGGRVVDQLVLLDVAGERVECRLEASSLDGAGG